MSPKVSRCAALAAFSLLCFNAHAVDQTWNGFVSGTFTQGSNWVSGAAPASTDSVRFTNPLSSTGIIVVDAVSTVQNVTVSGTTLGGQYEFRQIGASTLAIADAFTLAVNTPLNITGGSVIGAASTSLAAGSSLSLSSLSRLITSGLNSSGGTLQVNSSSTLTVNGNGAIGGGGHLRVLAGGDIVSARYIDIGNASAGTMLIDGAGSTITAGNITDWGAGAAGFGSVLFSNAAAGTYSTLRIGQSQGSASVSLQGSSQLTVNTGLFVGSAGTHTFLSVNLDSGTLTSNASSSFNNGAVINVNGGALNLNGNATFSAGSTLNWGSDAVNIASGRTLAFQGGVATANGGRSLSNGATLRISNGGQFSSTGNLNVADAVISGTVVVDGVNSRLTTGGAATNAWGSLPGNFATIAFNNSGAGTFANRVSIGHLGGKGQLTLDNDAFVTVNGLTTGNGTIATSVASIDLSGGTLSTTGTAHFRGGSVVNVAGGRLQLGADATFSANSTLNWSTGTLHIASGKTMTFDDGSGFFSGGSISSGGTLRVINAGRVDSENALHIGDGGGGSLVIDGPAADINVGGVPINFWGNNPGGNASIVFNNGGAGTFSNLQITANSAAASVSIAGSTLSVGTLVAGSAGSPGSSVLLNNGTLIIGGDATFGTGATLNVQGGGGTSLAMLPGRALTFNGGAGTINAETLIPAGITVTAINGGTFRVTDTVIANANFNVSGAGSSMSLGAAGTSNGAIFANAVGAQADLLVSGGAILDFPGIVLLGKDGGDATLSISSNGRVNFANSLQAGGGITTPGAATINISDGTLNGTAATGSSIFSTNTRVNLNSGALIAKQDLLFLGGSTFNWSGGTLDLAGGKSLTFGGGAGSFSVNAALHNGGSLTILSGGAVQTSGKFDIGNTTVGTGPSSGTLVINGAGSRFVSDAAAGNFSTWGGKPGDAATIIINQGAATFNAGLNIATAGGTAQVLLQSGASLNVASFSVGSTGFVGSYSGFISIADTSTLRSTGTTTLRGGTNIAFAGGSFSSAGTLAMHDNSRIELTNGANKSMRVGGLSMSDISVIDVSDNFMIVEYSGASPLQSIRSYVLDGYNDGNWLGIGLRSATAAVNPLSGLGYAEASVPLGLSGGIFRGQPVDGTTVLVAYTFKGDADINGIVNSIDFNLLQSGYGIKDGTAVWSQGDFDYNGKVNTVDFNSLSGNFGQTLASPLPGAELGAVVPEPFSLTMLLGLFAMTRRRSR